MSNLIRIACCALLAAGALTIPTAAVAASELPHPFVIYDDGLVNDWQNWSWATVALAVPVAAGKPIKVEGKAWEALFLHHELFNTKGYSKLTFIINGGVQGGQKLSVRLSANKAALDGVYQITPAAKTWARAEIKLEELHAVDKDIDGLQIQAGESPFPAWYITRIQFE